MRMAVPKRPARLPYLRVPRLASLMRKGQEAAGGGGACSKQALTTLLLGAWRHACVPHGAVRRMAEPVRYISACCLCASVESAIRPEAEPYIES